MSAQLYAKNNVQSAPMPGNESFNRPPRIVVSPPQGTITIPVPPARDSLPARPDMIMVLMPILMKATMFLAYAIISRGSTQQMIFLIPMAIFSIMSPVANLLNARQKRKTVKKRWREHDRKYRKILSKLRSQLIEKAEEQRQVALLADPDPATLVAHISERSHLWERRPDDPDFLAIRVGKGKRPFSMTLQVPDLEVTDVFVPDMQKIRDEFTFVGDIPCTVSLPKVKSLGIAGRRQDVAALTRTLLCQIAT